MSRDLEQPILVNNLLKKFGELDTRVDTTFPTDLPDRPPPTQHKTKQIKNFRPDLSSTLIHGFSFTKKCPCSELPLEVSNIRSITRNIQGEHLPCAAARPPPRPLPPSRRRPVRLPPSHRHMRRRRPCVRRVECDPRLFVRAFQLSSVDGPSFTYGTLPSARA